mmetsp:Transcript_28575/g.45924  ORF Transcript_28575/g.45924 Transcript_28575/m.45924 type:complete len:246 (+) Transcript_28575:328-1065(+)
MSHDEGVHPTPTSCATAASNSACSTITSANTFQPSPQVTMRSSASTSTTEARNSSCHPTASKIKPTSSATWISAKCRTRVFRSAASTSLRCERWRTSWRLLQKRAKIRRASAFWANSSSTTLWGTIWARCLGWFVNSARGANSVSTEGYGFIPLASARGSGGLPVSLHMKGPGSWLVRMLLPIPCWSRIGMTLFKSPGVRLAWRISTGLRAILLSCKPTPLSILLLSVVTAPICTNATSRWVAAT